MLASKAGQLGKKAKEVAGADELKTLNRQLDHANRVARGNPRPARIEKVANAKQRVDNFGNTQKSVTKMLTNYILQVGAARIKTENETSE